MEASGVTPVTFPADGKQQRRLCLLSWSICKMTHAALQPAVGYNTARLTTRRTADMFLVLLTGRHDLIERGVDAGMKPRNGELGNPAGKSI